MPAPNASAATVHGSCIALGTAGVLIRGVSGAGKSTLALLLLDRADLIGTAAALVGDDRICLTRDADGVTARPHPALEERIEVRGLGLCRVRNSQDCTRLVLVVDLVATMPRLPESAPEPLLILGTRIPRLVLDHAQLQSGLAPRLVLDALAACTGVAFETHRRILDMPSDLPP